MRQLTYLGPGKLEWREQAAPELSGPDEALVRPLAVATCDLDAAIVRGEVPFPPPFALGHEFVGEVTQVGSAVQAFRPGDRVAVSFQICCGRCDFCARSLPANCVGVPRESMYGIGSIGGSWGGAIADSVRVPFADAMLVALPEGVSVEAAASAPDNIGDAWRAVAPPLRARPQGLVGIFNGGPAGSIALYAVGIARALGAASVDYYDASEARLEVAKALGASTHRVEAWPRRCGPFAITMDSTQADEGLSLAIRSTEPGGRCTSTSMILRKQASVPITEMYMKGIEFATGRVQSRAVLPEVLRLLSGGAFDPLAVATRVADWEEAEEALLDYGTKLILTRRAGRA